MFHVTLEKGVGEVLKQVHTLCH